MFARKGQRDDRLDVGLIRKTAPGNWGGQITPGFRERFGQAYDTEFQRWVDLFSEDTDRRLHRRSLGVTAKPPAAVCEAGVQSLGSGRPVEVAMVSRDSIAGA